jgi:hypothetical protein
MSRGMPTGLKGRCIESRVALIAELIDTPLLKLELRTETVAHAKDKSKTHAIALFMTGRRGY